MGKLLLGLIVGIGLGLSIQAQAQDALKFETNGISQLSVNYGPLKYTLGEETMIFIHHSQEVKVDTHKLMELLETLE